jgi:hypothetical protein
MPQIEDKRPVHWVSKYIIRQHFNNGQFLKRVKSGELVIYVKKSSHPSQPPKGEPICTYSQIVYYYTLTGDPIAVVHQYLRPDGSLGASGLPDPKRLFLEDRILSVRTETSEK